MKPKQKNPHKHKKKHLDLRGFTLVEMLIVLAIIGLLASIILVSIGQARSSTRDTSRYDNIKTVRTALELYYYDNGHYPIYGSSDTAYPLDTALSGSTPPLLGGFISAIPSDPVDSGPYIYQYVWGWNRFAADSYGIYVPYEKFSPCKYRTPMYPSTRLWFGVKDCGDVDRGVQY